MADDTLIVEAIRIGFGKSREFHLVGHADARRTSAQTIIDARPDVILVDDMDRSDRAIELIGEIRTEDDVVAVIALTLEAEPVWLERLFCAGATAVISKATRPVVLALLVRETLDGHVHHPPSAVSAAAAPATVTTVPDLHLTGRELEILKLVAAGLTNGDIARHLWVTEQTVKFHLRNVFRKLNVSNRTQASHVAYVNGLVGPGLRRSTPVHGSPAAAYAAAAAGPATATSP